jgi:V/A-type H+-transporting ATPase subunit E
MEAQLKELIDKIKTEGVAEAEEKAGRILEKAERKAERVVAEAEKQAERIVAGAKAKADKFERTGRETMTQAARNVVLGLRSSIRELFESVVQRELKSALSEKDLQDIIYDLIRAWKKEGVDDLEVLLSPQDIKKLEKGTFDKLSREMKKGVEFRPLPEIQAGFRIGEKDGAAHYDFTDVGIAEYLTQYLSPKLAECVKSAVEDTGESDGKHHGGKHKKRKGH